MTTGSSAGCRRSRGAWARASGRLALLGFSALVAMACDKGDGAPPPALFTNPGDVELVCYDGDVDVDSANAESPVVLPRRCCEDPTANDDADEDHEVDEECHNKDPRPHALVTQTIRGEVGAVDLYEEEVLDSLRSIPGYNFIDVGGEPTAIVVPKAYPCPAGGDAEAGCGAPVFTYVSGRESDEVRAIATCRFRLGRPCGPSEGSPVQLVAQPHDMVLDPNGRALWLSLPTRGLVARVALGTDPDNRTPFELDETGKPKAPEYFPLASGIDLAPPEPVLEASYYMTCGLGYSYDPTVDPIKLPLAPRLASAGQPRPTRMQFADVGAEAPLLLIVDDAQAVVHALAVQGDQPEQRAILPVGAPLRDFAVTPAVPARAPTAAELASDTFAYDKDAADPSVIADTKRYLYGVDARDGTLLAFDLTASGGVPALTPLLAPAPARDTLHRFGNFRDRLGAGSDNAFVRALTVLDTRPKLLPDGTRDDNYCGWMSQEQVKEMKDAAEGLPSSDPQKQMAEYYEAVLRAGSEEEAPDALRGVFLLVTTSSGDVVVLDIHNLDLQCRARSNCDPNNPDAPKKNSEELGVALQRHAVRLGNIEAASVTISGSDDLEQEVFRFGVEDSDGGEEPAPDADGGGVEDRDGGEEPAPDEDGGGVDDSDGGVAPEQDADVPPESDTGAPFEPDEEGCPAGYYRIDAPATVCAAKSPWRARAYTWTAVYEGLLSAGASFTAALEDNGDGRLLMQAPQGFDFCERGVEQSGIALAIVSDPEDDTPEFCDRDDDEPWRFLVQEAYQDHLILLIDPEIKGPSNQPATLDDVRTCFSDFSQFQLRFSQSWRVLVGESAYTHRVMTGADGLCVIDDEIDSRWDAHTSFEQPYWDSFVAFQLRKPNPDTDAEKEGINPAITLDLDAPALRLQISTGPRYDTLPIRMRVFPESGWVFVVDAASQGLTPLLTFPTFDFDKTYH